jgi:hypothetical protein
MRLSGASMNWKKSLLMDLKVDCRPRGGGLLNKSRGGQSGHPCKLAHPFNPAALKST